MLAGQILSFIYFRMKNDSFWIKKYIFIKYLLRIYYLTAP